MSSTPIFQFNATKSTKNELNQTFSRGGRGVWLQFRLQICSCARIGPLKANYYPSIMAMHSFPLSMISICLILAFHFHSSICFDIEQSANFSLHRFRRSFEGLQDNCYEKCSQKYPREIGAFAFALGIMSGQHEGHFWDCFAKCVCVDPVPAKKGGAGGIKCPRS